MTFQRLMRERASGAGASPAERGGRDARSTQGKASMLDAAGCAIAGLLLIMGGTANASESGIINLDSKSAGASTLQADGDGNPVGSPSFNFVDDYDSGLDFSGSASTQYNDMGFAGSASSVWNHAYDPGNPGLGNAFSAVYMSGSSASNSTSDGIWWDQNSGFGSSVVYFSVASDTIWTFSADVTGTTAGFGGIAYNFLLYSDDFTTEYGRVEKFVSEGESLNDSVSISGVIPAGNYLFGLGVGAFQDYPFTAGSGSASIELTGGVFTIPEPSTLALLALGLACLHRARRGANGAGD